MPSSPSVADTNADEAESEKKKDPKHHVAWSPENEEILVEWADSAIVYRWMHNKAQETFSRLHAWFTIPAIVLSTISGTASFAQGSLPVSFQGFAPMVIGAINIGVGILSTVQQYLKISELNEAFRVSGISWDKFARNIRVELAKSPAERLDAYTFLKICRAEFDRLMETSPPIPPKVVAEFTKRFSGVSAMGMMNDANKMARFEKLKKPDICDIIISSDDYRHPWYKEIEKTRLLAEEQARREAEAAVEAAAEVARLAAMGLSEDDADDMEHRMQRDLLKREEELRRQEQEVRDKMREIQEHERREKLRLEEEANAQARVRQSQHQRIQDFVGQFQTGFGRLPLAEELQEQFAADSSLAQVLADFIADPVNAMV
jgi:flagellar biosynthesis GTPase FlhF